MDGWKYYKITMQLSWMNGGQCCDAELTMKLHAKSEGHAISEAKDRLGRIGTHKVEEAEAALEK